MQLEYKNIKKSTKKVQKTTKKQFKPNYLNILMDKFKSLIDTYLNNYEEYDYGKILFQCEYGELIFFKDKDNPNTLILYVIYIETKYRKKGLCRGIIQYLIDAGTERFDYLCVESVLSNVLYSYLERFHYKNNKFKILESGFVYSFY